MIYEDFSFHQMFSTMASRVSITIDRIYYFYIPRKCMARILVYFMYVLICAYRVCGGCSITFEMKVR